MTRAILLLAALALPALAHAQTPAKTHAERLAPLLDEQTIAVVHVDIGRLDVPAIIKEGQKLSGATPAEAAQAGLALQVGVAALKSAGVGDVYGVFSLDRAEDGPVLIVPAGQDTNEAVLRGLFTKMNFEAARIGGNLVFAPRPQTLERLRRGRGTPPGGLADALKSVEEDDVWALGFLPPALRRSLGEVVPQLPEQVGGGSTAPILDNFQWLAVTVRVAPDPEIVLAAKAPTPQAAKAMQKLHARILNRVAEELVKAYPPAAQFLPVLAGKVEGDAVVVQLAAKELNEIVAPAVAKFRAAADRMEGSNNLKQIALAMHNYHDLHKHFPPAASVDKDGKPLLSWRVHILPYVEQAELYRQFKLDEPWDSPHNKKLIAGMPAVYRSPASKAPADRTTYLVPVGNATIFFNKDGAQIRDITDGTSNTILVVDAPDDQAVIWTRPDDFDAAAEKSLQGLRTGSGQGFLAAFADGSVRFISASIDPMALRSMITRNGGEVIPQD